jgi:D-alanine-D-alanine ligase
MAEPLLADKRELECAYLSLGGSTVISDTGEIDVSGFYSFDKKYAQCEDVRICAVARVPRGINDTVRAYTRRLAVALGIDGTARFDYFLSGEALYFNEVNTVPGMTAASLYPAMLDKSGVPLSDFARMIADGAEK